MAMNDLYSESLYIKALLININEFCYMPQLTINSYLTVTLWSSDNLLMVLMLTCNLYIINDVRVTLSLILTLTHLP